LTEQCRAGGPISIAAFMTACLHDPEFGYYATRPALGGAHGDFITAPEASQMFGELLAAWSAHEWERLGAPRTLNWIELGPGSGALMQDALRAASQLEKFRAAARVTLVETSAPLRALQKQKVSKAVWVETLDRAPPGPALILANEFLDCLPVRQYARAPEGWREKLVGLGPEDALQFGYGPPIAAAPDGAVPEPTPTGWVREIAPALPALVDALAQRLRTAPGRALFIDYGYAAPEGADTLQALRRHAKEYPLAAPGEADLTAHVDFAALKALAIEAGLSVAGPTPQGAFLKALGIDQRAEALARAHPERAERIGREHDRLTGANSMGVLFKVICLSSPNLPPPAGF
jgi:NADH dehydrogenase [ubiquinone] 1 alpha subcomplex assembly factor 7